MKKQWQRNLIEKFVTRLSVIGIDVGLIGNYPWVYLDTVNDVKVSGLYQSDHGFTAFFLYEDSVWSDRKIVFSKIREMVTK